MIVTDRRDEIAGLEAKVAELEKAHTEYKRKGRVVHTEILKLKSDIRKLKAADEEEKTRKQAKAQIGRDLVKQDQVVSALRRVGKETTAGPICKALGEIYGIKLHNSEFASRYLEQVKKDSRVSIRVVSATCNKYSLAEWGVRK